MIASVCYPEGLEQAQASISMQWAKACIGFTRGATPTTCSGIPVSVKRGTTQHEVKRRGVCHYHRNHLTAPVHLFTASSQTRRCYLFLSRTGDDPKCLIKDHKHHPSAHVSEHASTQLSDMGIGTIWNSSFFKRRAVAHSVTRNKHFGCVEDKRHIVKRIMSQSNSGGLHTGKGAARRRLSFTKRLEIQRRIQGS